MNLMDTITLAQIYVFNTKILNAEEIQEIYKPEQKPVVITDILKISKLKIAIHQELIVIYIIYSIITITFYYILYMTKWVIFNYF